MGLLWMPGIFTDLSKEKPEELHQLNQFLIEVAKETNTVNELTFTATFTGFSATITGTATITYTERIVMLGLPTITGTSNATTMTITGLPSAFVPHISSEFIVRLTENGTIQAGLLTMGAGSVTLECFPAPAGGDFTASGTKAFFATTLTYAKRD